MPVNTIKILLVEDNPGDARLISETLSESYADQFELFYSEHLEAASNLVRREVFDLILLDLTLPDSSGLHTFERMHAQAPMVPIIVLTGLDVESLGTEAVKKGAQDYLIKGQVDTPLLIRSIHHAIEREFAAKELRLVYAEVQIAKDTLEQRIRERTRELENANQRILDAQEQLVRSERMVIIGRLAEGIAHDLNNPLGAIKNANYYLKRKLLGTQIIQSEPKIGLFLELIDDEVNHSASIISDLLAFAFLRAPQLESIDLTEVIEDALTSINPPRNTCVIRDLQPNLGRLMADGGQLCLVFENLANNALEAMPKGGKLRISSGRADGLIEVCFQDDGLGIKEETLQHLFEPLFTTKNKGSGFGLSICQQIISNHGGSIEVETLENHGTTFRVKLPMAGQEQAVGRFATCE